MITAQLKQALAFVTRQGRALLRAPRQGAPVGSIESLAMDLLSERGEATSMARADAIVRLYASLSKEQRELFHLFLALNLLPETTRLKAAAKAYLNAPSPETVSELALASESPRQELIRRMNVAPGATHLLVRMREEILASLDRHPQLRPLEQDLRRMLASWFNRGFLSLKRIDWSSSAVLLEKVIAYEAVHEIRGWDDLRRRLAPDRRCFAFFHPALPEEPLIFVEVALCQGLASKIAPLLSATAPVDDPAQGRRRDLLFDQQLPAGPARHLVRQLPDQAGGRRAARGAAGLKRFATLSPVPGFKRWLTQQAATSGDELPAAALDINWASAERVSPAIRSALQRLLASYLTSSNGGKGPDDPVARFHLGNGARLERLNWAANLSPRGIQESLGMMVNYLYEPKSIEDNHEQFVTVGRVARSSEVDDLIKRTAPQRKRKRQAQRQAQRTRAASRACVTRAGPQRSFCNSLAQ
jgi:malonyl-CoA decarboxylase